MQFVVHYWFPIIGDQQCNVTSSFPVSSKRIKNNFLDALASLDFKLSLSGSPFLELAHLRVFQSYFSSQTNIEFASLLEPSLLHFSFSRLSLTELSMFIDSQHSMFESV